MSDPICRAGGPAGCLGLRYFPDLCLQGESGALSPCREDRCSVLCPPLTRENKGLLIGYWITVPIIGENDQLVGGREALAPPGRPCP